jgi:sugar phosphate isomerase/epimerase
MQNLSVSTYCLNHLPTLTALPRLAAMGYRRVEIICFGKNGTPDLREAGSGAALAKHARESGLEIAALYPPPLNIHSPERRAETFASVAAAIEQAAQIGCRNLVFSPLLPRADYDYRMLAEDCERLAAIIGERDVRICLENHHQWPLSYVEDYEKVLTYVSHPAIGITVDTGHFTASSVDSAAFVRRFAERIYHVHLKDHIGEECVPMGQGETENRAVVEALREIGFDGYLTLEIEVKDQENIERYLVEARTYCRDVLGIE